MANMRIRLSGDSLSYMTLVKKKQGIEQECHGLWMDLLVPYPSKHVAQFASEA